MLKILKFFLNVFILSVFTASFAKEPPILHLVLEKGIVKIQTFAYLDKY